MIVPFGMAWDGADTTLGATEAKWHGIGEGVGRRLTVSAQGRGSGVRPRTTEMWCPAPGPQWTLPPSLKEPGRTRMPLRAVS